MNQPQQPNPTLHLIIGPRNSGKTNRLNQKIKEVQSAGKSAILIKLEGYSTRLIEACNPTNNGRVKLKWAEFLTELNVIEEEIFIDDAHNFDELPQTIRKFLKQGKNITVALLNGDAFQEPFQALSEILPFATKIDLCTAVCNSNKRYCQTIANCTNQLGPCCLSCTETI